MNTLIKQFKYFMTAICIATLLIVVAVFTSCSNTTKADYSLSSDVAGLKHYDKYQLTQSTIVSRHNLRSALTSSGSKLDSLTNCQWINWTSEPGELTLKGGEEETLMGQYFRQFAEKEGLIPHNWTPNKDEVYFYANSFQRTIATARFFASAFLPMTSVDVNYAEPMDKDNPVFYRKSTKNSQEFKDQCFKEISEANDGKSLVEISQSLSEQFKKMENLVDFKNSSYAKENNIESLPLDDINVTFDVGVGPKMTGSVATGNTIVDGLMMQYLEEEDDSKATFGKNISFKDFVDICDIDEAYQKTLWGTHTSGVDHSNLLLKEMLNDINNQNRKVTFLCGHDNTIMPLLAALNIEKYSLPYSLNDNAVIGYRLVVNKYKNSNGEEFCDLSLVYESVDQIRHRVAIDLDNPPVAFSVQLKGIERNDDGLYKMSDILKRIQDTINEYDKYN